MGKRALTLMLLVLSGPLFAKWDEVSKSDTGVMYADSASITKGVGGKSKIWALMDFSKPTSATPGGVEFLSMKQQLEFDCKNKQWRELWAGFYPKGMGYGTAIGTFNRPNSEFAPVPLETAAEYVMEKACAKK